MCITDTRGAASCEGHLRLRLRTGGPVNSSLIRRLRRETKANPAKAAALAVVLLVAIWFWVPLVVRWCSPSAAPSDAVTAPVASAEPTTLPPNGASSGGVPRRLPRRLRRSRGKGWCKGSSRILECGQVDNRDWDATRLDRPPPNWPRRKQNNSSNNRRKRPNARHPPN